MKLKTFKRIGALAVCVLAPLPSMAQQTYQEIEQLTVNENVTSFINITASGAKSPRIYIPTQYVFHIPVLFYQKQTIFTNTLKQFLYPQITT